MIKEILSGLFITVILLSLVYYTTNSVLDNTQQLKERILKERR